MKFSLIILTFILSLNIAFSQSSSDLQPGFNSQEALDMIQLCNSFTYIDLYDSDEEILPKGYKKLFTSPVIGMDNVFQIYRKGNVGVINFRGSTEKKSSWLENMSSTIIPAKGTIKTKGNTFDYKFASDTAAGVHSGYTLALAYLQKEIMQQVRHLNDHGVYDIIITGHSQGGALALLTNAYFSHLSKRKLDKKNRFKVYAFAHPMVGNIEFVEEYNKAFCASKMSYSIINPEDMVPKMPLSYNDSTYWKSHIMAMFSDNEEFSQNKMIQEGLTLLFQKKLQATVEKFSESVEKQIESELGEITMPDTKKEMNYATIGNVIKLPPPEYPLELKDSTILEDDVFLADNPRDKNGVFENKSVYKKTSMSQNHKPYNYYTAILKVYFPNKYKVVEPKLFGL